MKLIVYVLGITLIRNGETTDKEKGCLKMKQPTI